MFGDRGGDVRIGRVLIDARAMRCIIVFSN
jgi:hypothetical protein